MNSSDQLCNFIYFNLILRIVELDIEDEDDSFSSDDSPKKRSTKVVAPAMKSPNSLDSYRLGPKYRAILGGIQSLDQSSNLSSEQDSSFLSRHQEHKLSGGFGTARSDDD